VVIDGVTFNTGDDCIAIKSGRDADGRRVNVPSQNLVIQNCTFANGHGGITLGSEMTGGVKNVYARDLTMNSPNLQAGHRIKTNTLRGGYARNSNVYRITAATVGGPLLLIQGNYNAQTGDFPPDITGITITLDDLTITTSTAANSAQFVSNLVVNDVTVGGTPVTS
jgi:polygalacturonase